MVKRSEPPDHGQPNPKRRRLSELKPSERARLAVLVRQRSVIFEWHEDAERSQWAQQGALASLERRAVSLRTHAEQLSKIAGEMAAEVENLKVHLAQAEQREQRAIAAERRATEAIDAELLRLGLPYEGSAGPPTGWRGFSPDETDRAQGMDGLDEVFPLS